jgi:hypothetical protein
MLRIALALGLRLASLLIGAVDRRAAGIKRLVEWI